jgi:hypothetical protein
MEDAERNGEQQRRHIDGEQCPTSRARCGVEAIDDGPDDRCRDSDEQ